MAEGAVVDLGPNNATDPKVLATYEDMIAYHGLGDVVEIIADCLPEPSYTPYPDDPEGILRNIINTGVIKVGKMSSTPSVKSTTNLFSALSEDVLEGIVKLLGDNYGVNITIEYVWFGMRDDLDAALNAHTIDMLDQVNSIGGESNDLRRRAVRAFTCTLISSGQFAHVKAHAPWQTRAELLGTRGLNLCSGVLSTQTFNAFLRPEKEQTITTDYFRGEYKWCSDNVAAGVFDGYVSPTPVLWEDICPSLVSKGLLSASECNPNLKLRVIDLKIKAGTPYWVARD